MATVYVDSAVSSSGDGSTHSTAFKTLAEGLTAAGPGGEVRVNKTHNESLASGNMTLASPGTTQATAIRILCVDFTNNDADATGASVGTAAGNVLTTGCARSRGISYPTNGGLNAGLGVASWDIEDSAFSISTNGGGAAFGVNNASYTVSRFGLKNATVKFGGTSQWLYANGGGLTWKGGSLASGTQAPVTLLKSDNTGRSALAFVEAVDLSLLSSTSKLAVLSGMASSATFKECLLPASLVGGVAVAPMSLAPFSRGNLIRCSSGAGSFINETFAFEGAEFDATNVYRAGGTDDGVSGGVPRSRKLVTSANALPGTPFVSNDIQIWCDTAGSPVTVTFYGIAPGSTPPTNADIWLEAEYLKNAGNPLGGYAPGGGLATLQAAPSTYPIGAMAWTGAANVGSPATTFEMALTFTPAQKGPITLRVKAAKAGASFVYDSKPGVSVGGAALAISRSYVGPSGVTIHETGSVQTVTVDRPVPVAGRRFTF